MFGKIWCGALGPTAYQFGSIRGERFGNTLTIVAEVLPLFRERYYYLCLNGVYVDSYYADATGLLKATIPPSFGNSIDSIYLEDGGLTATPDEETAKLIVFAARQHASADAARICSEWDCIGQYETSIPTGTDQLSGITIAGAVRGRNCEKLNLLPSRGRLGITIENSGTTRTVRLYNRSTLVAQGSRENDGVITLDPIGTTGISMEATIAFTAKVELGSAFIDLQWPAGWYLHYSTSALSFPRQAQAWIPNTGGDIFSHLTGVLNPGSYNVALVAVDDEGESASPLTIDGSPFLIRSTPAAPTITAVTETSPYHFNVAFSNSDPAATSHTTYFSCVNDSVNGLDPMGSLLSSGPTPVTGSSPISIIVPMYTTQDYTSAFDDMESVFDSSAATLISAYQAGESGFASTLSDELADIAEAVEVFGDEIGQHLRAVDEQLLNSNAQMQATADSLEGNDFSIEEWQAYIAPSLSMYLQYMGVILDGTSTRYTLPGFGIPAENGSSIPSLQSILDIASPLVRPNRVSILVRAKNASGYEEKNGNMFILNLDDAGSKLTNKPNDAYIQSQTQVRGVGGLAVTITGAYLQDDQSEEPDYLDFYVEQEADPFDFSTPDASVLLGTAFAGMRTASTTINVSTTGWHKFTVKARKNSTRSEGYEAQQFYVSTNGPAQPANARGNVQGARGK